MKLDSVPYIARHSIFECFQDESTLSDNSSPKNFLADSTPARISVGRTGTRPKTDAWLRFRADHALARDAILSELRADFVEDFVKAKGYPFIKTIVESKEEFIQFPPKGKVVSAQTLLDVKKMCPADIDVQIVVSDGLSARAVEKNVSDLLPMIEDGLRLHKISFGLPIFVRYARVAVGDQLGFTLNAKLVVNLIGERPGLSSSKGLSAYITYHPSPQTISSDRTVVSNIHDRGTPPVEAGAYIVKLIKTILERKVSGVQLQKLS